MPACCMIQRPLRRTRGNKGAGLQASSQGGNRFPPCWVSSSAGDALSPAKPGSATARAEGPRGPWPRGRVTSPNSPGQQPVCLQSPRCPCSSKSVPCFQSWIFLALFSPLCCLSLPCVCCARFSGRGGEGVWSPRWDDPVPDPLALCPGEEPSLQLLSELLCG